MSTITHDLAQGSDAWSEFRLQHHGASEAAAMLGLSKRCKRNELLRAKHTGIAREFSDWVQEHILDPGHEVERLARPIVEEIIGDSLYPVTCSNGKLSASCDGLTDGIDKLLAFEHKQFADALFRQVADGIVPDEHMPQCQQVLMVTKAERLIFVVSDGARERMAYVWVDPDPAWFDRIRKGWAQFDADLLAYVAPPVTEIVTATPTQSLPALIVRMEGAVTVSDNLAEFGLALHAFIERIPAKPSTDQEFVDTDAACKTLKKTEEALEAEIERALAALAGMVDVSALLRIARDHQALARDTRLLKEKLVKSRKDEIKQERVDAGRAALLKHVTALNERIGGNWIKMPAPTIFGEAIKSLRTVDSLRNACDTLLASEKIRTNEIADRYDANRKTLKPTDPETGETTDWSHLVPDFGTIGGEAGEYFAAILAQRIQKHNDALRAQREREEQALIDTERRAAEQRERDDADKRRLAEAALQQAALQQNAQGGSLPVDAPAPGADPPGSYASNPSAATPGPSGAAGVAVAAIPAAAPAVSSADNEPTLSVGAINTRLSGPAAGKGLTMTADFIEQILGVVAKGKTKQGTGLWSESQLVAICGQLIQHISKASATPRADPDGRTRKSFEAVAA